jgi:prefoldin subunit 5
MSKQLDLIQNLYAQACQELGHLESNKQKIEQQIEKVRANIQALDQAVEIIKATLAKDLSGEGE